MARLRAAIFAIFAWLAAPAAFAADQNRAIGTENAALAPVRRSFAPSARLPELIDAALRYTPPQAMAEGKGSPNPFAPLHWIAITDNADAAERLLARGADPDTRDADGRTPLMVAAAFDSRSVAEMLLAYGADPLARDPVDGNSALDFAAMAGNADFSGMLLDHGVPVDGRATRNGETPLHYAAFYGRRAAIELLVARGADANVSDYSGVRPIQYARKRLQGLAVELLLKLGARPDNLHDAVNAGDVARVRQLIAEGADVHAFALSGPPLNLAAATGQAFVAAILIDAGADLEAEGDPLNSRPLHMAVIGNHPDMARLLVDRGAEIDSRDAQQRTPLIVAAAYGNTAAAEALLLEGADPLAVDIYSDTALHNAARSGSIPTAKLLMAGGIDVNVRSGHNGEPPLKYAAQLGDVHMVAFLIEAGADMDQRDNQSMTPLQTALYYSPKAQPVIDLLRRLGAEK